MGDDNPFERNMDLREAEDDVRRYAAEKYPRVAFPPELFDAILLRREGLSRNGLIRFFVPEAKSDIDAAARAPDMPAFIKQKQKEGEAHVAKYGTKTSYGPLFGLAYSSPSRRSTSTDLIATRRSCDGRGFAPQWTVRRPIRALYPHAPHARGATRTLCFAARRTYRPNALLLLLLLLPPPKTLVDRELT